MPQDKRNIRARCFKCKKIVTGIYHVTKVPVNSGGAPRQGQYWTCEVCGTTIDAD